jgi:hypothetical protein
MPGAEYNIFSSIMLVISMAEYLHQQLCERLLAALDDTRDPCARVGVGSANACMAAVFLLL